MNIWVDADSCPAPIKEILFRAAERTGVPLCLVANHEIKIPRSQTIRFLRVQAGFDVADNEIVKRLKPGDLVVTGDIPLAAEIIANDGIAMSSRGELHTRDNISARLTMRDLMESLRASGVDAGGQSTFSQSDRKAFANQLDKILQQANRQSC